MDFDKSRIFTAVNANELKVGDKVIVADCMSNLRTEVEYWGCPPAYIKTIYQIAFESFPSRFIVNDEGTRCFPLAYLVERKENCTNCGENCPRAGDTNIKDNNISNCSMWKSRQFNLQ